jgi:plasmid stabilization system protein ParE
MDYIVFYQVVEDDVEILRVVSGYRDLRGIFPNK